VHPFFKFVDQDNSGTIDYPEFEKYILNQAWKKTFTY
jgi:hypothetical protein